MEKLPDPFSMSEIMGKVEERTPYVVVAFQVILYYLRNMHIEKSSGRQHGFSQKMTAFLAEIYFHFRPFVFR